MRRPDRPGAFRSHRCGTLASASAAMGVQLRLPWTRRKLVTRAYWRVPACRQTPHRTRFLLCSEPMRDAIDQLFHGRAAGNCRVVPE